MRTYKKTPGERISTTARRMVEIADKTKRIIRTKFNEVELVVKPGSRAEKIVESYFKKAIPKAFLRDRWFLRTLF